MKPNPKNYEAFIDPAGGQWIRMKNGKYKDTVWRPADMKVENHPDNSEDGILTFQAEFLGEPPKDFNHFEKVAGTILTDILREHINNEDSSNNPS
jgi:hypothetical protein